jgi:peroxiredoxin
VEVVEAFESYVILPSSTNFVPNDFALPDHRGGVFRLSDRLGCGHTIVIFYRGHWCPYCVRYLSYKIQPNLARLTDGGGMVVAISPEPVRTSADLARRCGLEFLLLSDIDGRVIDQFGVRNGFVAATSMLPHPAVLIFDSDLQMRFKSVDRNYKKRTTLSTIYKALSTLRQPAL